MTQLNRLTRVNRVMTQLNRLTRVNRVMTRVNRLSWVNESGHVKLMKRFILIIMLSS
jgi:hypothetical protein